MSNQVKYYDYTPFIRVAGVTDKFQGSTDQSLRQDLYFKVLKNFITIFTILIANYTNSRAY